MSALVTVAVEGSVDAAVVGRLFQVTGLELGPVYGMQGKTKLDRQLAGYNQAAQHGRWLVLRDLDHDAACAPELVQELLEKRAPQMCFRIAVRAVETWLLADAASLSHFLGVPRKHIPSRPEELTHPKRTVVDLARRSRSRAIREDMVPAADTSAQVGPAYTARLIEFASSSWQPDIAAQCCDSLARCLAALHNCTEA